MSVQTSFIHHTETMATREGFGQGLVDAARINKSIFGLCADLTQSMCMSLFEQEFPRRFIQVGVAEQNLIGVAAGLALAGKIPFAASFAVFSPGRSWDQIRVSVCYNNLNVKIIGGHAGLATGADGATHQALEDIALMRVLPNMKVIEPADGLQAKQAVIALMDDIGPAYLRLTRPKLPLLNSQLDFQIGQAQILHPGKDATIIACGVMVHQALKAADQLARENIAVRVINMHTIKPIDQAAIINAFQETRVVISAEDHQITGGLGSAIAEVMSQKSNLMSSCQFSMIGVEDQFGESGTTQELQKKYGLSSQHIVKKIKSLLKKANN